MKETIELIKKLWANKRTKSLSILIIYFIFFSFVFLLIFNGSHSYKKPNIEEDEKNIIEDNQEIKLEDITNYKLEFVGEDNFTYDSSTNKIFYDGNYYEVNNIPEIISKYDLAIFSPSNISKLLEVGTLESTNYIDKSDTFVIKISDFERIIYNNEIINDEYIKITKYESKIVVDLTNYYGYVVNIELRS